MKKTSQKLLVALFIGFLSLSLLLTPFFQYNDIIGSLYESKDALFQYRTAFSTISDAFSENIVFLEKYSELHGGIQRIQSKNAVWGESAREAYMIGNDGKLYKMSLFSSLQETDAEGITASSRQKITECESALATFAKEVAARNAEFFFVQAPARYDSEYVSLPRVSSSNQAKMVDAFESLLREEESVHKVNLQRYFHEQKIPFDSWFFGTDHHWTIKTAFLAYQRLCQVINEETEIEINTSFYDENNWKTETAANEFIGSIGKLAGSGFIEKDDFDYIFPSFETDYKKESAYYPHTSITQGGSVVQQGSYTDAILNMHEKTITYGAYVGSDVCEVRLTNSKAATDKKILIIKDSFALPVSAFLSTCFEETRLLDLRYFHDGVLSYLDDYQPDIVLILYNPGAYGSPFFDFQ